MKKLIKIIIVGGVFIGLIAAGTWGLSLLRDRGDIESSFIDGCEKIEEKIKGQIQAANYCRSDADCRAEKIFCPWGEGSPCRFILVNRNHSTALLQKDVYSFVGCWQASEEMKKKYGHCSSERLDSDCSGLDGIITRCVDNRCVKEGN